MDRPDPEMPERYPGVIPDLTGEEVDAFILTVSGEADVQALRARIKRALDGSIDRCARCKVCDEQVDAVMSVFEVEEVSPDGLDHDS